MTMPVSHLQDVCKYLAGMLKEERGDQLALNRDEGGNQTQHLNYMLMRIPKFAQEGNREKAMRWLGFVQGHMAGQGIVDIDELKELNRSNGE